MYRIYNIYHLIINEFKQKLIEMPLKESVKFAIN
jgi:hypothetical protein